MKPLNLVDQYGNFRDLNDAEFQQLLEQIRQKEERRKKALLGRWTGEQMDKVAACVLGVVIVFAMLHKYHNADRDAIPSQAWSFGQPGE
jgi:hypothetical protein